MATASSVLQETHAGSESEIHNGTEAGPNLLPEADASSSSTSKVVEKNHTHSRHEYTWTPYQRQAIEKDQLIELGVVEEVFGACLPLLSETVERKLHDLVVQETSVMLRKVSKHKPAMVPGELMAALQSDVDGLLQEAMFEAVAHFREILFPLYELPNLKSCLSILDTAEEKKLMQDLQLVKESTKELMLQSAKNAAYEQVLDELDKQLMQADILAEEIQGFLKTHASKSLTGVQSEKYLVALNQTNEIEEILEGLEKQGIPSQPTEEI